MRPSPHPRIWVVLLLLPLLRPTPTSAQARERILYPLSPFVGCGAPIASLIADKHGNLYGTGLTGGGAPGAGCAFELSPSRVGWEETVLHSFSGADGSGPDGALVFDGAGNLYGTAEGGGAYDDGVAFELSPSVNGTWTETVLYNFGSHDGDGAGPEGNLIFDGRGNLYGTTRGGGAYDNVGTVFELSPSDGGWTEKVLYSFSGGINGPGPIIPLGCVVMDRAGHLYGAAADGGEYGGGAVFELDPYQGGYRERTINNLYDGTSIGFAAGFCCSRFVVRFVQDKHVPRFSLQQFLGTVLAAHQLARCDQEGLFMPLGRLHITFMISVQRRRWIPAQLLSVIHRPVQVELLAQLDLPLFQNSLRCQDQNSLRSPRHPRLAQ
ncbi:MAG: choice-of-anchor tandem repeat GloVer-containing protein [Candidatus Sulfotelmatobacter sp.]